MPALERTALLLSKVLSVTGLLALMALAAMTLADGLMRWLANQPIEGVRDAGALAIALAVSCCMPIALVERAHITIRVVEKFSRLASRLLDVAAALLVEAVLVAMAWQFWLHAGKLAQGKETTYVLQIPTAPFWYGVDVILWCAVAVQAVVLLSMLGKLGERSA